jgi:hypothetical protein
MLSAPHRESDSLAARSGSLWLTACSIEQVDGVRLADGSSVRNLQIVAPDVAPIDF